jgi:hypothetical protein
MIETTVGEPEGSPERWPALPHEEWKETQATLHLWLQIVGKIRVALVPWVNHQWHVTLHPTSRGLTSRPIPWRGGTFQIDFDFLDHDLLIAKSDGRKGRVALKPRSVADFHHDLMTELDGMGIPVEVHGSPNEVPDPIPFQEDERHGAYERAYVERFFRIVSNSARVFDDFRGGYIGKSSPVHFFWGAMDLAVTRFSGRRAPEHPGGMPHLPDRITREAYSHEVSSAGFWPGGDAHPHPLFYSYAYPSPEGFPEAAVRPGSARWDPDLSEFVLSYEDMRRARSPENELMKFLESTYEAAATLGDWDRESVEWGPGGRPPVGGYDRED